jgi:SAM-dependent methyltransferase
MTGSATARHFELAATRYGERRAAGPLGRLRAQETLAVRALAAVAPGDLVLDAGCGDGATLDWLAAAGCHAVGIDLAIGMTRACRRRGHRVAVQDFARPGLRGGFDHVLCVGALEFAADPGGALAALAALLRPGGRLILLYPHPLPLGPLYALYHRRHGVAIHLFSRARVGALLRGAGLVGPVGHRRGWLSSACVAVRPVTPT